MVQHVMKDNKKRMADSILVNIIFMLIYIFIKQNFLSLSRDNGVFAWIGEKRIKF